MSNPGAAASAVSGAAPLLPFLRMSLGDLLRSRAAGREDEEFVVWRPPKGPRRAWTYAQFVESVDRFANGLRALGVEPGARVCVHLENCPEFMVAWFALASIGCPMVATNTKSAPPELGYSLARSQAVALVTSPDLWSFGASAVPPSVEHVILTGSTGDDGYVAFDDLDGPPQPAVTVDPMSAAGIQFTSGTTSRPKGVVWTHANYLWGGRISARNERLQPGERHFTYMPLFHANAQIYSVLATLWVGGTVILVPKFSASTFWAVAVSERATYASMIPFAVRALKDQPVPEHSFRGWAMGLLFPRWEERFGIEITGFFGMTETVAQPIVSDPTVPPQPGAIGFAAPEYDIRVVDDHGRALAEGEGELEVRGVPGVSMALEYLDDDEATRGAYSSDGWFKTGDRVRVAVDGYITYLERAKDMLKVGAENVATSEVERVIASVAGVRDVAVVGRIDRMLDEVPVAFIVVESSFEDASVIEEVLAACQSELASFKMPREIVVLDALPRVTLEKISKAKLREIAEHRAASRVAAIGEEP